MFSLSVQSSSNEPIFIKEERKWAAGVFECNCSARPKARFCVFVFDAMQSVCATTSPKLKPKNVYIHYLRWQSDNSSFFKEDNALQFEVESDVDYFNVLF